MATSSAELGPPAGSDGPNAVPSANGGQVEAARGLEFVSPWEQGDAMGAQVEPGGIGVRLAGHGPGTQVRPPRVRRSY